MNTASNELAWFSMTSPLIKLRLHKAAKTPELVTVKTISRDTQIAGWHLKALLVVQIKPARKGSIATTWLEGITEYGTGKNETDAIADLVVSLGEYKEALEEREANLGDSALKELDLLRELLERLR